jgi:hypothetical protein
MTGRSAIGQIGCPVSRSSAKMSPCLVFWISALMGRPSTVTSSRIGAVGMS